MAHISAFVPFISVQVGGPGVCPHHPWQIYSNTHASKIRHHKPLQKPHRGFSRQKPKKIFQPTAKYIMFLLLYFVPFQKNGHFFM